MIKFYSNGNYVEFIARKKDRKGNLLDHMSIDYPIYSDDSSTVNIFSFLNTFFLDIMNRLTYLGEYPYISDWIEYNIVCSNNTKSGKVNLYSGIDLFVVSNNNKN